MDMSKFEPNSNEFASHWPYIAGLFALIAIFLSLFEIFKHMQYYNKPYLQKYIVRILWMVPIYALNSVCTSFFRCLIINNCLNLYSG